MPTDAIQSPLVQCEGHRIRNVFIYVCDALRWDFRPSAVAELGITFRTAVHGLYTPPGIASLATGCYPPRHGGIRFESTLQDEIDSIFSIQGTNHSLRHNQWEGHPVFSLLGQKVGLPLEDIESPFVYVEHDKGAHAPYPRFLADDCNVRETFISLSNQPDRLHQCYRDGVDSSVSRFKDRLSVLRERGLDQETLVIFTSDHGELLGEYGGFVGHSLPAAPELAFVPTVFIHPSLEPASIEDPIIEQADLLPTVRSVLDIAPPNETEYDGQSIVDSLPESRRAYNHSVSYFPGEGLLNDLMDPVYEARSLWTSGGGHVFLETNILKRVLTGFYDSTRSAETGSYNKSVNILSKLRRLMPMYLHSHRSFGEPGLDKTEASELCDAVIDRANSYDSELTSNTIQQLEDLGYR